MMPRASLPGADALFGLPPQTGSSESTTGDTPALDRRALALATELFAAEPEMVTEANTGDHSVVSAEVGAFLRWLVAHFEPTNLVEIGCASGSTGLWILEAMAHGAVLTSIEPDLETHEVAAKAFSHAQAKQRIRAINADVRTILPRLADAGYGMVVLHQPEPADLDDARRLLLPGGVLVTLAVADPAYQDTASRFLHLIADDGQFHTTFLPIATGVVVSTFQP